MHILLNGSFWHQPNVGSGQYLHNLVRWLSQIAPDNRYTLLLPVVDAAETPTPPGVTAVTLPTPFDRQRPNLAKLWFEQVTIPQFVRVLRRHLPEQQLLLHVPYFAPPVRSSIVPLITTIPDLIPLLLPEYRGGFHIRAYMRLVQLAAHRTDHVLTFSTHSRNDIVQYLRLRRQQISVIQLAAAERYQRLPTPAAMTQALGIVAQRYGVYPPFIYYVGGLDARKNVATLVRAVALLRDQGRWERLGTTLVIAGRALGEDRRLFPDIDGLIVQLGLQDAIQRIDVPHADGPLLYQTCTAFAFPSTYEGFGLPPLEAMACGAPVIVSNASSLLEVVGAAALCVAPGDIAGWAAAFEQVVLDQALQSELRTQGLVQAARFSWQRVAEETLAAYTMVLNRQPVR